MKALKAATAGRAALIRRFFVYCVIGLVAVVPALAQAAATAQGVALNAAASCSNASLDITLVTTNATTEYGQSTNLAGATLDTVGPASLLPPSLSPLSNFNGTFVGWNLLVNPAQPAQTLIGAYVYIGDAVPTAANTAEFFVFYNCTTRQVLAACIGPYGTCPKTALEGAFYANAKGIPTLTDGALALTVLLLATVGGMTVRRRQRQR